MVHTQFSKQVKVVRRDNGNEFNSNEVPPNNTEPSTTPNNTKPTSSAVEPTVEEPTVVPDLGRGHRLKFLNSGLRGYVFDTTQSPSPSSSSSPPSSPSAITGGVEPPSFKVAIRDDGWCRAMQEEITALENNGTWELSDLPPDKKAFEYKSDGSSYSDYSLFTYSSNEVCLHVLIYVDYLVITGNDSSVISSFREYLHRYFHMKDLGPVKYFLGIEVARSDEGIFLNQRKYTLDIVTEMSLLRAKPASTPMEPNLQLGTDQSNLLADPECYRRLVGRLVYLAFTWPNMAFAVHTLSQFLHNPRERGSYGGRLKCCSLSLRKSRSRCQMSSFSRGHHRDGKEPMGDLEGSIEWDDDGGENGIAENLILIGKLWASRAINVKAAIDTMNKLWNTSKPMAGNVVDAKDKTFIFRFGAARDKARVLEGQPWHFEKFVWCFNEPNPAGKITDVPLFHFPIWTRVYDLPIAGRTNLANAQKIGNCLGKFISLEHGPNAELDRAIRIRVLYDIQVPLKASVPVRMKDGRTIEFTVKYERLPTYCYGCGLIGHGEKDCEDGPYEEDDLKVGEWLRASPWKVTKTVKEGGGKVARDLRPCFDAERVIDSEGAVSLMIDKLQAISLELKNRKSENKKMREQAMQSGSRESEVSEREPIVEEQTGGMVTDVDGGRGGKGDLVRECSAAGNRRESEGGGEREGELRSCLEVMELDMGAGNTEEQGTMGKGKQGGKGGGGTGGSWQRLVRADMAASKTVGRVMVKEHGEKRDREELSVVEMQKRARVLLDGGVLIPEAEGLGNSDTVRALRAFVRKEAPAILFLCETKLCGREMRRVKERLEGYHGLEVDSAGRSGGLAFLWKKEIDCVFMSSSLHHMDFTIRSESGEWRITGFYGWPNVTDRHLSWDLLKLLGQQSTLPWVCIGDYNEILFSTEMKGGNRPQWQMNNFREAVDACGLRDVSWEGYNFSWDNGQVGEANRQCMLDRAMCSSAWTDKFPYAQLTYMDREWSDHAPIKLCLNKRDSGGRKKRGFKFEQIWVGEDGCREAIDRGVEKGGADLGRVLNECARELKAWKGTRISELNWDISRKTKQLHRLNEGERSVENVGKRKKLIAELAELRRKEEQYWRQRSRALWLKDGDRNTKFFHTRAGERKQKNFIARLIDDDGNVKTDEEGIGTVAIEYFQRLFSTSNPSNFEVLEDMTQRVTPGMNECLTKEYSEEEVTEALNQMHPLKAPGPDGMNELFFQTYWGTVGPAVVDTVLNILRGNVMPTEFNTTNIVLIPKKKAPDKVSDLRPISLCNVVYKLVSKILANRLKLFLSDIVSENQSAFTPGRMISDNVLIAFELFHYMKNSRSAEGFMAIKLDMAKAYDRIEWEFLKRVLIVMGFDSAWIDRVMACVTTVSFSVLINGSPSRRFAPSRGLRQGDPLSPYLFILCAEVLSWLMRRAVENNSLHGIRIVPGAPSVSHLLFADDSIFFVKANVEEAEVVNSILRRYEAASGQLVSLEKTTVSFSKGSPLQRRSNLAARLCISEVDEHSRYLGLPTVVGRSKKVLTDILRDKLSKRVSGWRGKILSRAGKEVLIKAVVNSLPTYVMSIFKIPASFCDELRSLISRFWWGHEEGKRGISWVAWRRLCMPKGMGGMGFRDFNLFNLALIGKQVWRLLTETEGLWARMMRARYYPHGNIMTADLGNNPSYTWRGILEARRAVESGLRRRIGDGRSTRIWVDAWIPCSNSGRVLSPCGPGREQLLVADLMDGNGWREDMVSNLFLPFEQERIRNIRLSTNRPCDEWFWSKEKDGVYSVKSAYRCLAGERKAIDWSGVSNWEREKWLWNRLWNVPVWPRVKLFFWQLCHEALATRANIATRVRGDNSFCSLCNSFFETSSHFFKECIVAQRVWEGLEINRDEEEGVGIRDWVEARWREMGVREQARFMVGCWALWEHRNKVVFDQREVDPGDVIKRAWDVVEETDSGGWGFEGNGGGGYRRQDQERRKGWERPKEGFVKVNVDAGVKEEDGVSLGVVCRDCEGRVLWGISCVQEQVWEPQVAEAVAVLEGVMEARRRGYTKVVIESDCLQVIDALKRKAKGRSDLALVIDDILAASSYFNSVLWSYTCRVNNSVAHSLAHLFPRSVGRFVWSGDLPPIANNAVSFDLSLMQ
ncbi:uncharacterized protein LOC141589722 [Silene latifolia]|uniref:uncharacterized protein LOC141589722 n=1 Tax=Silene latifolia TaxID=37657 RepID=UPI003D7866D7